MVEFTFFIIKAEQQGSDLLSFGEVTESANHAVGAPPALDLYHRAFAAEIRIVTPLCDDSIGLFIP